MKNKIYFKLQLKRAAKIYPSILIVTLIMVMSIALVAGVLVYSSLNRSDKQKLNIGVVGDTSESYLGVGITALKELDNSKYSIEIIETDKETAEQAVRSGEFSGYLNIPDGFLRGIWTGNNVPAEYYVLNDTTGFETVLLSEVASVASEWVVRAQNTISALDSLSKAESLPYKKENLDKHVMNMNLINIENVLGRKSAYNLEVLGIADSVSMEGYYICGIIMFFLLIWGVSCNKLLIRTNYALPRSLRARGINSAEQVFCEYMGYLGITLITVFGAAFLLGIVVSFADFGIEELSGKGFLSTLFFAVKLVPVVIMITSMHLMFYELVSGTVNSVVLQFLVAVAFAYISGCFYPDYFFPEAVAKFGAALPSGVGMTYMRKCMKSGITFSDVGAILAYIAAFSGITVFARKRRMAGDER